MPRHACPRCGRAVRQYELEDFFALDEQPPPPLSSVLSGVWWLAHTLRRTESRAGWLEIEEMLDRLGVVETGARDAWREAIWIIEDAEARGKELRMIRLDEERSERSRGETYG